MVICVIVGSASALVLHFLGNGPAQFLAFCKHFRRGRKRRTDRFSHQLETKALQALFGHLTGLTAPAIAAEYGGQVGLELDGAEVGQHLPHRFGDVAVEGRDTEDQGAGLFHQVAQFTGGQTVDVIAADLDAVAIGAAGHGVGHLLRAAVGGKKQDDDFFVL